MVWSSSRSQGCEAGARSRWIIAAPQGAIEAHRRLQARLTGKDCLRFSIDQAALRLEQIEKIDRAGTELHLGDPIGLARVLQSVEARCLDTLLISGLRDADFGFL